MKGPRLIFVAKPSPDVVAAMRMAIARNGLQNSNLSPEENWHQSLSDRYADTPATRHKMLCAGGQVKAQACTLILNRIRDQVHKDKDARHETIHWAFRARGRPPCFNALLAAVQQALNDEGLATSSGHTPHSTISYWAPTRLGPTRTDSIAWTIGELLLVVGGHSERYSYETIGR